VRHLTSGIICLGLAASLVAGAMSLVPGQPGDWGLALWDPRAARAEAERAERLDEEREATLRRLAAKERTVEETLAGRLTLLRAAARFRDTNAGVTADYRRAWLLTTRGGSDEERYCRQVLRFVEEEVRGRADGAAVLARLRAQLDEARARGDLRLPD
jgi:hypothetical protein